MGNKKELLLLSPLIILFFLPLLRGENYNIENISTTFISLLYHVKSLINGEIPFWLSKLGMGTTFPLATDLSRYFPSYILYFEPHEIFFSLYVGIHIGISWLCFYLILLHYGFKNITYIHVLIFSFYFSNFFITTLYVNWLVLYYFAAIWIPIIFWSTLNLKIKKFSIHSCALWTLIILSCFYSTYIRIFLIICIFQFVCLFLIFSKFPKKNELLVSCFFIIILLLGSFDKTYLFIEEAIIGGVPSSNAFATYKSPLSVLNQFLKPFFIPINNDLLKYKEEFGSQGISNYIFANISFTPTPFKFINIGISITIFALIGAISLLKENKRKLFIITSALFLFAFLSLAPVQIFRNLSGNWLAEPFFYFFVILSACLGIKYWNKIFKRKYHSLLRILIIIHISTLAYTFIPISYHLITDKEISWFKYRTIVTDHTIPPYGLGYDYRGYGNDLFQKEIIKLTGPKDRVIMTRNTREVIRAESSYKRLQFSAFNQIEKKKLFNERFHFVKNQNDKNRCNFFRGATIKNDNVNVFNHYPKGKNLANYIQDVQWPGIYLFRPEKFFINNYNLLDLMGITILVTPEEEMGNFKENYQLEKIINCPFDNKKVAIMKSKKPLGMAYISNGKFPEQVSYYKNCPYKIKMCYDVTSYRKNINHDISSEIVFSSGTNYLKASLPNNNLEDFYLHFTNYFRPGWKAYDEKGNLYEVEEDYLGFTAVKVDKNVKTIKIVYRPILKVIFYYLYFSIIIFLLFIIIYKKRFDKY